MADRADGFGLFVLAQARRPSVREGSFALPRDGLEQLELDLALGAGSFRLDGAAEQLVEVRSTAGDIAPRVSRDGPRGRVRLRQDPRWFPFGYRGPISWQIHLARDIPTALALSAGAGDFALDLSAIRIVDAALTFGAAQARVVLPRPSGEVAVRISSGAASVTIQVPQGVEARVAAVGGLLQLDGRTETPGYAASSDRVTVSVSGGASAIHVI